MPPDYWPHLLTLLAILIVLISAALQAGDPRPWSWLRSLYTAIALTTIVLAGIVGGYLLITNAGVHFATLTLCAATTGIAIVVTAVTALRRARPRQP